MSFPDSIGVLIENSDIIILDEPINALDEVAAKQVHEILDEHKQRGAIIIACHDKEELKMLSDEIIEISYGKSSNKNQMNKYSVYMYMKGFVIKI